MQLEYDYEAFLKALGARVKTLRKERGWSQRDMVVEHGYHDTQWRKTERGKGLSIPSLLRLATVFDLSISQLLDGLGEYPKKALPDQIPREITTKQNSAKEAR